MAVVLGTRELSQLIPFKANCPKVTFDGLITKTILSGSMSSSKISKDRNYCYLNRRPIDMPKKVKALFAEVYRQYNASMSPIIILNLEVEANNYDINVSPDKREIFIKNESEVLEDLKGKLVDFFESI